MFCGCARYDPYVGSMADMFECLTPLKFSPIRMVLGPWTHGDHALTYAGDVDFGPQSTFDRNVAPTFQGARVEVKGITLIYMPFADDAHPDWCRPRS